MSHHPLRAGVLIIGSLLWDINDPIRRQWQEQNLQIENKIPVTLPIRYGRFSDKRKTYTMVFSSNAFASPGTGYAVPFNQDILTLDQVHTQVRRLLEAENSPNEPRNSYDLSFCVAAFLTNPKHQRSPHPLISELRQYWRNALSQKFTPNDYHVPGEAAMVSDNAELQIAWPDVLNAFDFLIATVTKPRPRDRDYPSPEEIAKHVTPNANDYFTNNRTAGIMTFQDTDIAALKRTVAP